MFNIISGMTIIMNKRYSWIWLILFLHGIAYTQPGEPDTTFGEYGFVITDIGEKDAISTIVIQPDQKIISAGSTGPGFGGISDIAIVRNNPDGSYDKNFGDNGIVIIDYDDGDITGNAMLLQPDGHIVIAGAVNHQHATTYEFEDDFLVIRLNKNGELDTTFGDTGIVITDLGSWWDEAHEVLIQSDGKIIVAGLSVSETNGKASFSMVRYELDGSVDTTFGVNGVIHTFIQGNAVANSGAIQPDGKIILAGYTLEEYEEDFAVVRYHQDGMVDTTFGINGIVQTDISDNDLSDAAQSIIIEGDGKISLVGYANYALGEPISNSGMVRYNTNGTLDEDFGVNGVKIINIGSSSYLNDHLALNGTYILIGAATVDSITRGLIVQLNNTGEFDTTFSDQGIALFDPEFLRRGYGVAIQEDHKIVVGGEAQYNYALARLLPDSATTTKIQSIESMMISIAPNPCKDFISIKIDVQSGPLECMISDLTGRLIKNESIYPGPDGKIFLDTKILNPGFYLLGITHNLKKGVAPFVVGK